MREYRTPLLTILLIAVVAFLASYALGAFNKDGITVVVDEEFGDKTFTYSGTLKDGFFNGRGSINLKNGAVYNGGFDNGRFSGDGVYYSAAPGSSPTGGSAIDNIDPTDWYFTGAFQSGRIINGTYYLASGPISLAEYQFSSVALSAHAWAYSGSFSDRGPNGIGTYTFADGSVYRGNFSNGAANGQGELTAPDGSAVYVGEFSGGVFNGQGAYYNPDGSAVYVGEFSGGTFNGQGVYYSPDGWYYEGGFVDGLFNGEGCVTNGDLAIRGIWKKGVQTVRYE